MEVAKFDGKRDYALWKTRVLAHLGLLGLKEALKNDKEEDGEKSDPALEEKKRKARRMIIESIEDKDLRNKITKEETAAGMFQVLEKLYTSATRNVYLNQKLYGFKMNENQSVEENVDEFEGLVSDLRYMNVSVPDEDQALLLLMSLPERFDHLKDVLRYGRTNLTVNDVISAVRIKELEFGSVSKSKGKKKKGVCWICGEDGHYKNQCSSKNFKKT